MVPAWFGAVATLFLGMLTYECSHNINASIFASSIMAIIPAHIMRSVGGGYDNESIAVTAMCATFYFWSVTARSSASPFAHMLCYFFHMHFFVSTGTIRISMSHTRHCFAPLYDFPIRGIVQSNIL